MDFESGPPLSIPDLSAIAEQTYANLSLIAAASQSGHDDVIPQFNSIMLVIRIKLMRKETT